MCFDTLNRILRLRTNLNYFENRVISLITRQWAAWKLYFMEREREQFITESGNEGRDIRDNRYVKQFKCCIQEIKRECQEQLTQESVELKLLENIKIHREESLSNLICYYGLWQSA